MPQHASHLERKPLDELCAQLGDDFTMLVDTFLEATPQLLEQMSDALSAGDIATLHRHAHSLKSSAATYGAMRLSALARALEHDTSANQLTGAAHVIAVLRAEFAAAATELRDIASR